MDAIELLTTRRSVRKLGLPVPSAEQLEIIYQAGTQVPDHANLKPYRFIQISGELPKKRFHEALLKGAGDNLELVEKSKIFINLAPMIIAVIYTPRAEAPVKIPDWEKELTAGCSAYAIQLASKALGFDNIWLSGAWVKMDAVREALHLQNEEKIVALIMLGTAEKSLDAPKNTDLSALVEVWS